jgi:hypothetical protein
MRKERRERIGFGNAGWVRYVQDEPPVQAYVRFADQDGRLVAVDILLSSDAGLDTNSLRHFSIARLEALVNDPEAPWVRERINIPGPLVREAAAFYATSYGSREPDHWAKQMIVGQYPDTNYPKARLPGPRKTPAGSQSVEHVFEEPEYGLVVEIPKGRSYGDDFYRDVAKKYSAAARAYRRPAVQIAEANGVPTATVHRWVKEARRRGFLGVARPGKAG